MTGSSGVTGQAERAVRRQQGDRRRSVTGSTGTVRGGDVRRVRYPKLLPLMAGRAGAIGGVVVLMAVTAAAGSGRWRHGDRLGVALHAAKLGVPQVREVHRAGARRAVSNRDGDSDSPGLLPLLDGVAMGAIRLLGCLMMADLTSPGRLESQPAVEIPGRMTGQAGKPLMARMRKAVERRARGLAP